jgi:spore germination cell wall hydrolase CwlJ-like protein
MTPLVVGSPERRWRLGRRGEFLTSIAASAAIMATAPSARAQTSGSSPLEDRAQATECLTLAIAYEAGYESEEGQQAVAEVVLNRVRDPAFPKSVCGVVFSGSSRRTGCQFTFTCDGSLRRRLPDAVLAHARLIAGQALDGQLPPLVGDAINYHAFYVSPYWAPTLERVRSIGAHIFYRRPNGTPATALADLPATTVRPAPQSAPAKTPFAPWGLMPSIPAAVPDRTSGTPSPGSINP